MEAELFVGNLSRSTTREELNALFAQAGEVTAADVVKDRKRSCKCASVVTIDTKAAGLEGRR